MSRFSRILRRTICCLLGVVSGVCAAQQSTQFNALPYVQKTGGRVTSFLPGSFQNPSAGVDILYINAPAIINQNPIIVAGAMLNGIPTYAVLGENSIQFTKASNVVAALGSFTNTTSTTDFAFAISGVSTDNLCIYYGTGYTIAQIENNQGVDTPFSGGNTYPPQGNKSGCMTLPVPPLVVKQPIFSYIAALPFTNTTGALSQLLVEDSANNLLYVIANNGATGNTLPGFTLLSPPIPLADGAGPIYTGSFDKLTGNFDQHGNAFFIINGQTGHSATVYIGDGNGGFTAQPPLTFTNGVDSMLLQDMDVPADGIADMVVEGDNGVITIHKGNGDGTFVTASEGGTSASPNALSGIGGHLAAIDPKTLNILTTTPIGLSVLTPQTGTLTYTLKGIYNIGPGRSSYALASFGSGNLAVDSAEGVAFVQGNADGSFNTSLAYSALAPALGATMGQFTSIGNPTNNVDVVVSTAAANAVQGQLLIGNGLGAFTAVVLPTNPLASLMTHQPPAGLWSNILSGDFNGDGKLDLAYSLTGLPLPTPGTGSGLYVQYGKGDGTFQNPAAPVTPSGASSGSNTLYGESAAGLFDKSGNAGIANIDANYDDTLLWQSSNTFNVGLNLRESNTSLNQVAAGYFKTGSSYQDLVFQQGATTLVPYINKQNGSGTFTAGTPLTVPSPVGNYAGNYAISTVLLTDIDNDGNGDILALYHNLASDPSNPSASTSTPNWLYIWWGKGDGTFSQTPFTLQLTRNYYLAAVADMNGDTLPDIVLSDGYLVGILYNQGALSSPPNQSFGNETHFLAGQGINSLTLQSVRGSMVPDLVVANGGATISNAIVLGGATQTSANLPANPADINTGGITVLLNNITALQTTGTLTSSPDPSAIGATFTITATLTPTAGQPAPTGTITFYLDGNPVTGCSTVVATVPGTTTSSAQCTVPIGNSYGGGVHPMNAVYLGDTNNAQVTLSGTHNILDIATTTVLALCIGGSSPNCPVTGAPIGTLTVVPSLSMTYGEVYNGTETITDQDGSTFAGTGTLDFYQDGVLLCTLQASSTIPCPPNVGTGTPAGTHVYVSEYSGDGTYGPSTSQPVTITVTPDTPAVTVSGSPNPAPSGQAVTLTATLLGANAPLGTPISPVGNYIPPRGSVVFMNGSTVLCGPSVVLAPSSTGVSSIATCTTTTLPVGTDQITASYAGNQDIDFNGAASAAFPETITKVNTTDFTVSATPNPASAGVGYAALLTVTVAVYNGFAEGVNLTCGSLPNEATCTFAPAAIASGGGTSQLIVLTTAPHSCGTTQPYFLGGNGGGPHLAPFALPALAGLAAFLIPGKRRWLRALMALIAVAGTTQMMGCGNCTDLGTKPATYTFQVIGTSASTGEVQSQTVTLNITI
jgi:Bacterial Ig-like domain (group 3)